MEQLLPYIKGIAAFISSFGVVAVAAYLIYKEYRSGATTLNGQVIANYKALDEQQKRQLAEKDAAILQYQKDVAEIKAAMQKMRQEFANDVGKLQGELKAKDEQIKLLQATILDKNPEMVKLLEEIRNFMENIYTQNQHQTNMLERGQTRNEKIDDATAHESGKILRNEVPTP